MEETPYDVAEINKLIRNRRSVYPVQFSDKIIAPEVIQQILENANWAPTHKKTEPWRFFIFAGEAKEDLGKFQAEMYKKNTVPEDFKEMKFNKLLNNSLKSSHVIAIVVKTNPDKVPQIEETSAVACAVQNIYLTATAYGVGGYWSTGGITYMSEAKEYFDLEEDEFLMGFFYMGYPAKEVPDNKRGDIQEKIIWM